MEKPYDIVGVGNAIVDILAYTDNAFLDEQGLEKGVMKLVDEVEAKKIYNAMGAATECSGGSVANTIAGLAGLEAKTGFIGRVKDDQFGDIFRHDLQRSGVHFNTPAATEGKPTAHCLVLVTHDGPSSIQAKNTERTMATYLGASTEMDRDDIDFDLLTQAKVMYVEGYLWDQLDVRDVIAEAMDAVHAAGGKIGFTLSDPLCVERHRDAFLSLLEGKIDLLFANEKEIRTLYEEQDLRKIFYKIQGMCELAVITRGASGSVVVDQNGEIHTIEAEKVEEVYDVTGAGDLYASGFLYGYVNHFSHEQSARLGSLCAAEVIKFLGGRPLTELSPFIAQAQSA